MCSRIHVIAVRLIAGFHVVSRLRDDADLQYVFSGKQHKGRGRKKKYDGKIDFKKLKAMYCLVISKQIEIKTSLSIRRFNTEIKKITDAKMLNKLTRKEVIVNGKITKTAQVLLSKLNLLH